MECLSLALDPSSRYLATAGFNASRVRILFSTTVVYRYGGLCEVSLLASPLHLIPEADTLLLLSSALVVYAFASHSLPHTPPEELTPVNDQESKGEHQQVPIR
jgi:hypothetical protein